VQEKYFLNNYLFLLFTFGNTEVSTQDLAFARQVLYKPERHPKPFLLSNRMLLLQVGHHTQLFID
jgi:hypothetical protein